MCSLLTPHPNSDSIQGGHLIPTVIQLKVLNLGVPLHVCVVDAQPWNFFTCLCCRYSSMDRLKQCGGTVRPDAPDRFCLRDVITFSAFLSKQTVPSVAA